MVYSMRSSGRILLAAGVLAAVSGTAAAQVAIDFEAPAYNGSAAGTLLTTGFGGGGQNGWYNPVSGSNDSHVFTYTGNTYGIVANPQGGDQFQVGRHAGAAAFSRAQKDVNFSAGGEWIVKWDVLVMYTGAGPAEDNIGSFSLQPSATSRYWQQIIQWPVTPTSTPTHFRLNYGVFNIPPYNQALPTFVSPGPAWTNLEVNKWYRQTTRWNFDTARILEVTIQDLAAGTPPTVVDVSGMDWYLFGGPNSVSPLPIAMRLFTGGGGGATLEGNLTAWDNIVVEPVVAACYANCDGSTVEPVLNIDDFTCFINAFAAGSILPHAQQVTHYANCDGSTIAPALNIDDFTCFINAFALGCP